MRGLCKLAVVLVLVLAIAGCSSSKVSESTDSSSSSQAQQVVDAIKPRIGEEFSNVSLRWDTANNNGEVVFLVTMSTTNPDNGRAGYTFEDGSTLILTPKWEGMREVLADVKVIEAP